MVKQKYPKVLQKITSLHLKLNKYNKLLQIFKIIPLFIRYVFYPTFLETLISNEFLSRAQADCRLLQLLAYRHFVSKGTWQNCCCCSSKSKWLLVYVLSTHAGQKQSSSFIWFSFFRYSWWAKVDLKNLTSYARQTLQRDNLKDQDTAW